MTGLFSLYHPAINPLHHNKTWPITHWTRLSKPFPILGNASNCLLKNCASHSMQTTVQLTRAYVGSLLNVRPPDRQGLYAPSFASNIVLGSYTSTECHAPSGICTPYFPSRGHSLTRYRSNTFASMPSAITVPQSPITGPPQSSFGFKS